MRFQNTAQMPTSYSCFPRAHFGRVLEPPRSQTAWHLVHTAVKGGWLGGGREEEDLCSLICVAFAHPHVTPQSSIYSPSDLRSKIVAYPQGSTAHFHSLFITEVFNIPPNEINFIPLSPSQIQTAWDAGTIDAAFCWGSAYDYIKATGTVLITARSLSAWGKETFNNFVYDDKWLAESPDNTEHVKKFTEILSTLDMDYIINPDAWGVGSANVASCASVCLRDTTTDAFYADSVKTLAAFEFFTPATQISCRYLADPDLNCAQEGTAVSTAATADFLRDQKVITESFPPDFYAAFVTSAFVILAIAAEPTLDDFTPLSSTYPTDEPGAGKPGQKRNETHTARSVPLISYATTRAPNAPLLCSHRLPLLFTHLHGSCVWLTHGYVCVQARRARERRPSAPTRASSPTATAPSARTPTAWTASS